MVSSAPPRARLSHEEPERGRGGPRHRCPSHRHRCTDPGKTLAYTQPRGVVAAIDDPQGVKPRVIFVTCPLVPLTRRCFRLARGPLGGTAETPRTSCNSRVDGKISVIFPSFVHLSLRVRTFLERSAAPLT